MKQTDYNNRVEPQLGWLDDPQVFRAGQLPAHSDHRFYGSEEEYRSGKSSLSQSLNGKWQFAWAKNAAQRPAEFYRTDSGWDRLRSLFNKSWEKQNNERTAGAVHR